MGRGRGLNALLWGDGRDRAAVLPRLAARLPERYERVIRCPRANEARGGEQPAGGQLRGQDGDLRCAARPDREASLGLPLWRPVGTETSLRPARHSRVRRSTRRRRCESRCGRPPSTAILKVKVGTAAPRPRPSSRMIRAEAPSAGDYGSMRILAWTVKAGDRGHPMLEGMGRRARRAASVRPNGSGGAPRRVRALSRIPIVG